MAEDKTKKKPRIRKVETVRERNQKAAEKAGKQAEKVRLRRTRKVVKKAASPFRIFKKPLLVVSWPLRTRPVRFVGRVLGRILWPKYFRESFREVRQVSWPSRRETWKLTAAVLIFAIAFGLAAAGTDWVLDKIIRRIVFRG